MEEKNQSFNEKMDKLLETAKKKKNVLDEQEVLDAFAGEDLTPEKLDRIYDLLERKNIDVLRMSEDLDIDSISPCRTAWASRTRSACT